MKVDIQVDVGQGWQFLAPGDSLSTLFSMESLILLNPHLCTEKEIKRLGRQIHPSLALGSHLSYYRLQEGVLPIQAGSPKH